MAGRGVTIREQALGAAPIEALNISTIGIVGTAPDAAVEELKKTGLMDKDRVFTNPDGSIKYNEPILITKRTDAKIGEEGSLPMALDTIYAQGGATVAMVIVPKTEDQEAANTVPNFATELVGTVGGIDDATKWAVVNMSGQLYLYISGSNSAAPNVLLTREGRVFEVEKSSTKVAEYTATGPAEESGSNVRIPVRLTALAAQTPAASTNLSVTQQSAIVGRDEDRTAATGAFSDPDNNHNPSGVYALLDAESVVGRKPRLIGAPGLDTGTRPSDAKNPLAAALEIVATRLRGIAYLDATNTNHEAALTYVGDFDSDRTYVLDPGGLVTNPDGELVDAALSGFALGLTARVDAKDGWWNNPSNRSMNGIQKLKRPIDYGASDPNSRAVSLNENHIATCIRYQGGFKLFGPRTTKKNSPFRYLSVRRIADNIEDSVQEAMFYYIDKNVTKNFLRQVVNRANGFLRNMVALGALIGAECYVDGELNTPDSIAQGKVYFNVKFTPPYPAEEIIFTFDLVNDYLTSISL